MVLSAVVLLLCIISRLCAFSTAPITCADLATNDTYQLSFEGSWSYRQLDPVKAPLDTGAVGYMSYGDCWHGPRGLLWTHPLGLTVSTQNGTSRCSAAGYEWRPDYAVSNASCFDDENLTTLGITMAIAYQSNATVCTRYTGRRQSSLRAMPPLTLIFSGSAPPPTQEQMSAHFARSKHGDGVDLIMKAYAVYAGNKLSINRTWAIRASFNGVKNLHVNTSAYSWSVKMPPMQPSDSDMTQFFEASFCVTETERDIGPQPSSLVGAIYDPSATTRDVDRWLSELGMLDTRYAMVSERKVSLANSWYQFWFNTEHDCGNWIVPIITPSMSHYGRGMWLWDSGFHVMALLAGGNGQARSLLKAQQQLEVLIAAGQKVGHVPRVVGPNGMETTTQPPGILTWAAMVVFNHTQDMSFLEKAYVSFSQNNQWFYSTKGYKPDNASGLCKWGHTDSGWDTSPRWDNGTVEAVDLNGWLRLDQMLLAEMAALLNRSAEAHAWRVKSNSTAKAMQKQLWSELDGVFWDRLPVTATNLLDPTQKRLRHSGQHIKVVTPATYWSLLAAVATATQASRQISAFWNSRDLDTPFAMPSVGASESRFDPNDYWRGPVWVNVNWLAGIGFDCYGRVAESSILRNQTCTLVSMHPTPREYYNPFNGSGLGAHNFMWTGAVDIITINEQHDNTLARDVLHSALLCDKIPQKSDDSDLLMTTHNQSWQQQARRRNLLSARVISEQDLFSSSDTSIYVCFRTMSIVQTDRSLHVFVEARRGNCIDQPSGGTDVLTRRSTDRGRSFSVARRLVGNGIGSSCVYRNPYATYDKLTRRLILNFVNTTNCSSTDPCFSRWNSKQIYSDSDGDSWTAPVDVNWNINSTSSLRGEGCLMGPGHGIQLSQQRSNPAQQGWLLMCGSSTFQGNKAKPGSIVSISRDGGTSWQPTALIPSANECSIVETSDGTLVFNGRGRFGHVPELGTPRIQAISTSGGLTWSSPKPIAGIKGPGAAGGLALTRASNMDVLWMSNPDTADQNFRANVSLSTSLDNGQHWLNILRVYTGPSSYSVLSPLTNDSDNSKPFTELGLLYERCNASEADPGPAPWHQCWWGRKRSSERVSFAVIKTAATISSNVNPSLWGIRVLDAATQRPVPAARITVLNYVAEWTDSNGWTAFAEPDFGNVNTSDGFIVYVDLQSDGYEKVGYHVNAKLGSSVVLTMQRLELAERMYRVTGASIYGASVRLGVKLSTLQREVVEKHYLRQGIVGQDAMISVPHYRSQQAFFTFGDTRSVSDGAGQTMISSAVAPTTALESAGVFDALPLTYHVGSADTVIPSLPLHISADSVCTFGAPFARVGLNDSSVEVGALSSWMNNSSKEEELWVIFTKRPRGNMGHSWAQCTSCCWGVARWNSSISQFVPQALFPLQSPLFGLVTASQSIIMNGYLYFCLRKPEVRVRLDQIANFSAFERVAVATPSTWESKLNRAAIAWVEQIHRFVIIACGREPHMGDIFVAFSSQLVGPWSEPQRVLSHNFTNNTLYNPAIHSVVHDRLDGQLYLIWSGSLSSGYTSVSTTFHDASVLIPRYNYNVMMYRLSLAPFVA